MPDRRTHRGPHPKDSQLFSSAVTPVLRKATADLSWLFSRGYSIDASVKLVGDRYQLAARQRLAVARCAVGDDSLDLRANCELSAENLRDRHLLIDGYNLLTTIEAALARAVIIVGRDGCYRDMASMHGTYRNVHETAPAIELIGNALSELQIASAHWLLDSPVSNSGRLATRMRASAESHDWAWKVELVPDPDSVMINRSHEMVNITADSVILDSNLPWFNLARHIIDAYITDAWIADLDSD